MSLELAAKHLASKGRGPDSMLVHMAPREVAGLQALARAHGGSLTVNPQTGLPEASFLSSILPAVAGAALAPFTGGLSAALIVGGGYGLASGSLMKGITAGLGAYGGAGLMEGLTGAGISGAAGELANQGASAASAMGEGANARDILLARSSEAAGPAMSALNSGTTAAGLNAVASNPSSIADAMGGWGSVAKNAAMAAAPVFADMMVPTATQMPSGSGPNPFRYTYSRGVQSPFPQPSPDGREQQYYAPSYTRVDPVTGGPYKAPGMADGGPVMPDPQGIEQRYAAPTYTQVKAPEQSQDQQGGIMGLFMNNPLLQKLMHAEQPYTPEYQYTFNPGMQSMSAGGVSHLGDYSDGGRLLRGPGDGVSDSIPATIEDKRPARLADGEFVVPARIVSELGNGSTEAGSRKLYAMMDRVQKARGKTVGKGKVAVNSRADKLLPA